MTKIRILNAEQMGVEDTLENGQIIEVDPVGVHGYEENESYYYFGCEWENKYFEIVEEEPEMTTFKKMKMRINNPEHSEAVQEWLFEQGYHWQVFSKNISLTDKEYLFTGSRSDTHITCSGAVYDFEANANGEVDVQHLDPHLYTVHKASKVPAKSFTAKPQQSTFDNMLKNLKHVQKAIEKADNKQSKRLKDRDRMMSKINEMLPEGFVVQVSGESVVEKSVKFDPEEIVEGSVWECLVKGEIDVTQGNRYAVLAHSDGTDVSIEDDVSNNTWDVTAFRAKFKRIS